MYLKQTKDKYTEILQLSSFNLLTYAHVQYRAMSCKKGQQKDPILKKTTVLCPPKSYYSLYPWCMDYFLRGGGLQLHPGRGDLQVRVEWVQQSFKKITTCRGENINVNVNVNVCSFTAGWICEEIIIFKKYCSFVFFLVLTVFRNYENTFKLIPLS